MSNQKSKFRDEPSRSVRPESASEEIEDRLAGLLPEDALQGALAGLAPEEITGPGGLMTQLAGRVLETALGAELTEHLGYPPAGAARRRGQQPQRRDRQAGSHRARDGRDQDAAGPQRQLCAAAGPQAPDASGRPR